MKKTLITLIFCGFATVILAQDLPNVGFENWGMNFLYEGLADWQSSDSQGAADVSGVMKSLDAYSGDYSVRLEPRLEGEDTIFSYIYQGEIGEEGPAGGFPYTSDFDKFSGFYKCNMPEEDSATLYVIKYLAGVPTFNFYKVGGVFEDWTAFSFDIMPGSCDEVFIGLISSDVDIETNIEFDSWVQFDSVYFENAGVEPAPIPNHDMETWEDVEYFDIDDWYTMNAFLFATGLVPAAQTTDAYSGTYAVELTTLLLYGEHLIPGYFSLGEITMEEETPILPIPYAYQPTSLRGYYKYTPEIGDEAGVHIQFTLSETVVGGDFFAFTPVAEWTYFEVPFVYSDVPDNLELVFFSGDIEGSVLLIDDIHFDFTVDANQIEVNTFSIYPNPADNYFVLYSNTTKNDNIIITDLQGRTVKLVSSSSPSTKVDVSDISSGVYFVSFGADKNLVKRLIVK